ncbi:MAG: DUF805 domain-containing protein [Planktomarina sp.]
MSFMEAVKTCLSKYVTFSGRASRSEFWWFYLFTIIVSVVAGVVDGAVGTAGLVGMIANLALILPTISAGVRRMHDTNRSGWWILVPLYSIYLWIQKSDEGENRFG